MSLKFNLNKKKQVSGESTGKAKIYAETHWEMHLKALGGHFIVPKGYWDSLGNAQIALETFSAMLTK
jgi:hypothetical protein